MPVQMTTAQYTAKYGAPPGATPPPAPASAPPAAPHASFLSQLASLVPGQQLGTDIEKAGSNIFNLITGGKAKFEANLPQNTVDVPKLIGDVGNIGLLFAPVGRATSAVTKVITPAVEKVVPKAAATAVPKIAPYLAKVGVGAATGYGMDVATNLQQGKGSRSFSPALGTVVGAGIPAVAPLAKVAGRAASEMAGVGTGAQYGSIKAAQDAMQAGGDAVDAFRSALRGNTSPEQVVQNARGALDSIVQQRSDAYRNALAEISNNKTSLDATPIFDALKSNLNKFGFNVGVDGAVDFSQSPIRFDRKAQSEVQTIVDEMRKFGLRPGDRTAVGIDSLKQAFGDLYSDSSKVRAFTASMSDATRKVLSQVPGYDQMASDYADKTSLIKEIQRGLSLNDKASTDTAFRKLTGVLRQNNEFRQQLAAELNQETGGTLIPQIAGTQLNSLVPRGLAKYADPIVAGTAVLSGVGIVPMLSAALFTSPRVVGETINALGISANKAGPLIRAISPQSAKIPWNAIFPNTPEPDDYKSNFSSSHDVNPVYDPTSSNTPATNATPASKSIPQTLHPTRMTRQEYMEKYGQPPPAPKPVSVAIPASSRIAYVDNNPGNLRFVGQPGAVPGVAGFARFKSPAAGFAALKRQVQLDQSRGLSLASFVSKYAPPSENDTRQYIQQVATTLGADPMTPIRRISADRLARAMAQKESSTHVA